MMRGLGLQSVLEYCTLIGMDAMAQFEGRVEKDWTGMAEESFWKREDEPSAQSATRLESDQLTVA